ncbi:MAG: 5'-nucleotidase C-terminal domain-containing protein, partial [Firmicutes bacterium]|nr:5'-nucleotidase C-terminal domain-containing protein [Bacillota bacterium]
MKSIRKTASILLALCLIMSMSTSVFASTFTDAHGNVIELDDTLEAYSNYLLKGANDAARKGETNLGDLWADALRWYAASGKMAAAFDEDDIKAGNDKIDVDSENIVALWNGGNLRDDIAEGKFGAEELAKVLPYPNKVAVVYMSGAQLVEALEAASQGLPYRDSTAAAAASFMQVSGLKYTVDISKPYDKGEAYGKNWFKAASLGRVTITEVNGQPFSENETYAVITSNANYNGMDSSYIFKECAEANEKSTISGGVVRDVVWMYIDEVLENVVGQEYAQPQGRITICGNPFSDVDEELAPAAEWAVVNGITEGTSPDKFSPEKTITRAQAVTFLWRAAGCPKAEGENPFEDVAEGTYYYDAVLWAAANG